MWQTVPEAATGDWKSSVADSYDTGGTTQPAVLFKLTVTVTEMAK